MLQIYPSQIDLFITNFWIFLIFFFVLVPQIQRSMLRSARRSVLSRLSEERGSTVITMIHRQETVSFFGIPLARYIDIDDSENILRAIRLAPKDKPIDLIIHTPGGLATAASQIALALRDHPAETRVIIPHYAMSGGTLIALAADKIIMDRHAVLGPVDPQLSTQNGVFPAGSILRVLETKPISEVSDTTIVLAEEARKAIKQMEDLIKDLLRGRYEEERINAIIEELVHGKYTHDYPITYGKLVELLGENRVTTDVPKLVYDLMRLYEMEVKPRRPGVEYIPVRG